MILDIDKKEKIFARTVYETPQGQQIVHAWYLCRLTVIGTKHLSFNVKVEDIKKFCEQNEIMSLNVFHCDEDQIFLLFLTPDVKEKHINLLLIPIFYTL